MPLSADTNKRYAFSLETDKDKPEAERPALLCRFLSKRDYDVVMELTAAAIAAGRGPVVNDNVKTIINVCVVGWNNYPGEYSWSGLIGQLSDDELWEVAQLAPIEGRLAAQAKLFFGLPSPVVAAESAKPVVAESA